MENVQRLTILHSIGDVIDILGSVPVHETGFFHEIEFLVREEAAANSYTTVCTLQN